MVIQNQKSERMLEEKGWEWVMLKEVRAKPLLDEERRGRIRGILNASCVKSNIKDGYSM